MIFCEQGTIGPGEVTLSSHWVNSQTDQVVAAMVRFMVSLSLHPYLQETHCGGLGDFTSIDAFLKAASVAVTPR